MPYLDSLNFTCGDKIGIVIRFKDTHSAPAKQQYGHTDCILPSGAPVGFLAANGKSLFGHGKVWSYSDFCNMHRLHYVDIEAARNAQCISTVLVIHCGQERAKAFYRNWLLLSQKPGLFMIMGRGCATRAAKVCLSSRVIDETGLLDIIEGVDLPDNLYRQLIRQTCTWESFSGYLGFSQCEAGNELKAQFDVNMEIISCVNQQSKGISVRR